ncbi:MAG: hypothetical protein IPL47_13045 [Phyllobacteriaceae bacterium]|nr:hypothetical protein [Phyllobacteriaceae bacterium]
MPAPAFDRPKWASPVAVAAGMFALLTLMSGGRALFGGPEAVAAVGDAVPFVLWFNFLAGFAYLAAAAGLYRWRKWAIPAAWAIGGMTLLVFVAFGVAVALGTPFEPRTIGAMIHRRASGWRSPSPVPAPFPQL